MALDAIANSAVFTGKFCEFKVLAGVILWVSQAHSKYKQWFASLNAVPNSNRTVKRHDYFWRTRHVLGFYFVVEQ